MIQQEGNFLIKLSDMTDGDWLLCLFLHTPVTEASVPLPLSLLLCLLLLSLVAFV